MLDYRIGDGVGRLPRREVTNVAENDPPIRRALRIGGEFKAERSLGTVDRWPLADALSRSEPE